MQDPAHRAIEMGSGEFVFLKDYKSAKLTWNKYVTGCLTVVIWADVQATRLAARHSLNHAKHAGSQGRDAFILKNFGSIHSRTRSHDLDTISVLWDPGLLKLRYVQACMIQSLLEIVCS
jgi:hypothetical protein